MAYVTGKRSLWLRLLLGAVVGFMVALPAAILVVRATNAPTEYAAALYKDGFNYDILRDEKNYISFLKSGAKIDTAQFKAQDGGDLKGAIDARDGVVMLLAYDPKCAFCAKAGEQIRRVSKSMSEAGVKYFFVSFYRLENPSEFYGAADSYNAGIPSFVWTGAGQGENFTFSATTPSHILIAPDGTILRVWPGVLEEKEAQGRMATQIAADTQAILDALRALKVQPTETAAQ
jgi:hypothetical protein